MDILRLGLTVFGGSSGGAPTAADLYTGAKASWQINSSTTAYVLLDETADGNIKFTGTSVAGTSSPARNVQPDFYPVATKGAEAGCIVSTLSWADLNLEEGYEWVQLGTSVYFVSGVMNSSQTLANDPFDSTKGGAGIVHSANWNGTYSQGVNPF
jgi:hypothetical protein